MAFSVRRYGTSVRETHAAVVVAETFPYAARNHSLGALVEGLVAPHDFGFHFVILIDLVNCVFTTIPSFISCASPFSRQS